MSVLPPDDAPPPPCSTTPRRATSPSLRAPRPDPPASARRVMWSYEEEQELRSLCARFPRDKVDWDEVASQLKERVPLPEGKARTAGTCLARFRALGTSSDPRSLAKEEKLKGGSALCSARVLPGSRLGFGFGGRRVRPGRISAPETFGEEVGEQ
jgi:hypothetical protein